MANNPKRTSAAANAACDAMAALCNGGKLRIFSGTQPANADAAVSGDATLLAELTLANPAFAAAIAGVATANAVGADVSADNNGTATWFRVVQADGVTTVYDGTVGLAACDLNLNAVNIVAGARVEVSGMTLTEGKG